MIPLIVLIAVCSLFVIGGIVQFFIAKKHKKSANCDSKIAENKGEFKMAYVMMVMGILFFLVGLFFT
jgi:uncharacterized protein YjeT (DUF2065 family)